MNNRELDKLLKTITPPPRGESYWLAFPRRVRNAIRVGGHGESVVAFPWWRRTSFQVGMAAALIVCAAVVTLSLVRSERREHLMTQTLLSCYRHTADLFPGQLRAVVLDSGGARLELAETASIPLAPPVIVRVFHHSRRAAILTFSGQSVEALGLEFEVLASGEGSFIFVSREGAWGGGERAIGEGWRFEAEWVKTQM